MCFHDSVEDQVSRVQFSEFHVRPHPDLPLYLPTPHTLGKEWTQGLLDREFSVPGTQRNGPEGRDRLHGGESLGFTDPLPMGRAEATERPEWGHLKQGTQSRTQHGQV